MIFQIESTQFKLSISGEKTKQTFSGQKFDVQVKTQTFSGLKLNILGQKFDVFDRQKIEGESKVGNGEVCFDGFCPKTCNQSFSPYLSLSLFPSPSLFLSLFLSKIFYLLFVFPSCFLFFPFVLFLFSLMSTNIFDLYL